MASSGASNSYVSAQPQGCALVTRTLRRLQAVSRSTSCAAAGGRCSKLSREQERLIAYVSNNVLERRKIRLFCKPRASLMVGTSSSGSLMAESPHNALQGELPPGLQSQAPGLSVSCPRPASVKVSRAPRTRGDVEPEAQACARSWVEEGGGMRALPSVSSPDWLASPRSLQAGFRRYRDALTGILEGRSKGEHIHIAPGSIVR